MEERALGAAVGDGAKVDADEIHYVFEPAV
jgi:hypothetical protein